MWDYVGTDQWEEGTPRDEELWEYVVRNTGLLVIIRTNMGGGGCSAVTSWEAREIFTHTQPAQEAARNSSAEAGLPSMAV